MSVNEPVELDEKIADTGGPADPGYDAWLRAKVKRGLAQARDREAMIPIEQVLRDILDPAGEAEADARAEADVREGRLINHAAVTRWIRSWGSKTVLPRPKIGEGGSTKSGARWDQ